jgi:hypothetical protein
MDVTIRVDGTGAARSLHTWLENELSFGSGRVRRDGEVIHLDLHETAPLHGVAQALHRWQAFRSGHPTLFLQSDAGELEVAADDPDAVSRIARWLALSEPVRNDWTGPTGPTGPTEPGPPDYAGPGPSPGTGFPTDV